MMHLPNSLKSLMLALKEGKATLYVPPTNLSVGKLSLPCQNLFSTCSFGSKHVTPRTLSARYLGNLVCVEGIVTVCKSNLTLPSSINPVGPNVVVMVTHRFAGASQGGEECALLSCNQEDHREEIHRPYFP